MPAYQLACYIRRIFSAQVDLAVPVLSAGNIEAGGTGKTPFILYLAEVISRNSRHPAIVCYAHKKNASGDEPAFFIQRAKDVPVFAGRNKLELLKTAAATNPDIVLLDDGFHIFSVARKIDVVLYDSGLQSHLLLPAGRMRLPFSFLKYADCIIVTHAKTLNKTRKEKIRGRLMKFGKPVFFAGHQPVCLVTQQGEPVPLSFIAGKKILAVCGIGKPWYFFKAISSLGADTVCAIPYPDHFYYQEADIAELAETARNYHLDACVTTEKDIMKLSGLLSVLPVYALRIKFVIENEQEFLRALPLGVNS